MMTFTPMFIGNIGATEIILILLIIMLLFGGRKIPELMRGLGRGMKEFKDAANKDYSAENGSGKAKAASDEPHQRRRRPQRRRKPADNPAETSGRSESAASEKPKSEEAPKREGARKPRRKPTAKKSEGDAQPQQPAPAQPAQEGAEKPHRPRRRRPRKPAEPKTNE